MAESKGGQGPNGETGAGRVADPEVKQDVSIDWQAGTVTVRVQRGLALPQMTVIPIQVWMRVATEIINNAFPVGGNVTTGKPSRILRPR